MIHLKACPPLLRTDGAKAFEVYCEGLNLGDVTRVKEILRRFSIPDARVMIVKGWFHETFPRVEIPRVALLHIDAYWHQPVKWCLEKFFDRVQLGGWVVLDDYG